MEPDMQREVIDLTADTDDENDEARRDPTLTPPTETVAATAAAGVKLEASKDLTPSGTAKRKNHERKGRPVAGSLNLLHLERRVDKGQSVSPDSTRKRVKTEGPGGKGRGDEVMAEDESCLGSMQYYGAEVETEERPSQVTLKTRAALRQSHRVSFLGGSRPSEKKEGWRQHDGMEFWIDDELPDTCIRLSKDSMILAKINTKCGIGVAQVLEVLEDPHGEAGLAVRYGWFPADVVDLKLLDFPKVSVQFPRQVFWQKDDCEDGVRHVSGHNEGRAWNDVLSWTHVGAPCVVKHRSVLTPEELQACRQPLPESEVAASLDPDHPEIFFYSMQYDHTVKRFETEWLERDAGIKEDPLGCEGPLIMWDAFCGAGNCSKGAQLLTEAVRRAAQALGNSTAAKRGFDVKVGIEYDKEIFGSYLDNTSGGDMDLGEFMSLEAFVEGVRKYQETGEMPKWGVPPKKDSVHLLHASPPCQSLSKLNMFSDEGSIENKLFPILEQLVELVRLIRPTFFTLEEVTTFLMHWAPLAGKQKGSGTKVVRCVWAIVLPLLDEGYQIDVRILNAVHYAVPQLRKRLIMFAAKPGYVLPRPPTPWTHYDANPDDAEEPSDSVDMPEKRGRRGCSLVENCRDKALLNVPPSWEKPCWASVAVGSAAAHAGPAGPLPAALTARDAIDDLPLSVLPGQGMQTHQYGRGWIKKQTDYVKFLRSEEDKCLYHNWLPKAEKNTLKCLNSPEKRSDYDQPYPTIFGSVSHHAAHMLCPRPDSNRLCSVAEKKRMQCMMDGMRLGGHISKQMQQVGNAVPMLLAWAIFGAVFEAAYGVEAPLPDFVKQRQIAAGKRAAEAPAEEASLETLSMEGMENGAPSAESDLVRPDEEAGPSTAHAAASAPRKPAAALGPPTPEKLPQPPPSRRPCKAAAAAAAGAGAAAHVPAAAGKQSAIAGLADAAVATERAAAKPPARRVRTASVESPTAAAAEALQELAEENTPKRQRVGAAVDEEIPRHVLRIMGSPGGRGGSPGHPRGVRQTIEFYSHSERPISLAPTPKRGLPAPRHRPGHARRSASPPPLSPWAGRAPRSPANREVPPASVASATGGTSVPSTAQPSPAAASTAPLDAPQHPAPDRAAAAGNTAAAEKVIPDDNGSATAEAPAAEVGLESGSPRQLDGGMFPLDRSRTASPARLAAAAAGKASAAGFDDDAAPPNTQVHQAMAGIGALLGHLEGTPAKHPADAENARGSEAEEEVDIVGWGPEDALLLEGKAAANALADEMANGAVRSADAICDLTSDDMRIFEDGAHAAPDQDVAAAPEKDVAEAPEQAASEPLQPPPLPARPAASAQAAPPTQEPSWLEEEFGPPGPYHQRPAHAAALGPSPSTGAAAAGETSLSGAQASQPATSCAAAAGGSKAVTCPGTGAGRTEEGISVTDPIARAPASSAGVAAASVGGGLSLSGAAEREDVVERGQRSKCGEASSEEGDIEISLSLDDF